MFFQKSALLFAFLLFADETKSILKQTRLVLQTNKTADFTPKTIFALTAELTMGKLLRVEIFLSPQLLIVCFEWNKLFCLGVENCFMFGIWFAGHSTNLLLCQTEPLKFFCKSSLERTSGQSLNWKPKSQQTANTFFSHAYFYKVIRCNLLIVCAHYKSLLIFKWIKSDIPLRFAKKWRQKSSSKFQINVDQRICLMFCIQVMNVRWTKAYQRWPQLNISWVKTFGDTHTSGVLDDKLIPQTVLIMLLFT